ncbi:MAG TPA: hypothetical protein VGL20_08775 [Candidatus Dormibacteraeota bacterium]|jgi:uncharacterized membrane protein
MARLHLPAEIRRPAISTPAAPEPSTDHDDADGDSRAFTLDLAQAVRISVGILWMAWALAWLGLQGKVAYAPWLNGAALLIGLVVIGVAARPHTPEFWRRHDRVVFAAALMFVGLYLAASSTAHMYETDEVTIGQVSATALINGHNPYGRDMTSEINSFNLPPTVATPTLDGRNVATATYPALSFLAYVPLGLLLGTRTSYALLTDGLFYLGFLVVLWRLAPTNVRPLITVIALSPFFAAFVDSGVTDVVYLPFILLALYRWDRYGVRTELSWARWMGPVALGLACAVKPTPWLMAPLLVTGIAIEAHRRGPGWWRSPLRYGLTAGAVFTAIDLPFILASPASWFRGAFLPIVEPLVPLGHGIVALSTSLGIGGGQLRWLTVASLVAIVASIAAFVGWHEHAKRMLPLLAMVPLLVATRSLMSYFLYVPILLIISVGTNRDGALWALGRAGAMTRRAARVVAVGAAVAVTGCVAGFVVAQAPMQLRLVAQLHGVAGDGRDTTTLVVTATNRTGRPIRPYFTLSTGQTTNVGFGAVSGPAELPAHATATYRIQPVSRNALLGKGDVYVIEGFSASPASISTSPQYVAT